MNAPKRQSDPIQAAVIYCRVSTTDQSSNGHGLESQESRCRDHAKDHGYAVEAVFPDDVSGGGDFMKRPGMVALLSFLDAQPEKRYAVIFDDLKRFARDTEFHIKLRREFDKRGARVECLNFKFEDSPEGKFIETIIAAQGELEREQNARQVRQKMRERVKRGYWVFHAPPGYRYGKDPQHGKLLIRDEPVASVIQEALEGYATGRFQTQGQVLAFLQDHPDYPKPSSGKLHPQRVVELLTRPHYAGYIEVPSWGLPLTRAHHEPLISFETYQKIQDRRAGRKLTAHRAERAEDFVLRGAVACGCCGVPYRSAWSKGRSKKYPYYVCQTKGCASYGKSIARDKVETAFAGFLKALRPTRMVFAAAEAMFREAWEQQAAQAAHRATALDAELKEIEAEKDRLLDRIVKTQNDAAAEAIEKRLCELETKRCLTLEKQAAAAVPPHTYKEVLEPAMLFLSNPWKLWEKGGYTLRRTVLRLVLDGHFLYDRKTGPRTAKTTLPFKVLGGFCGEREGMVPPHGLEPRTY